MFAVLFLATTLPVRAQPIEVTSSGSCAIVGMTDEQARHIALQRARSAAIEQAAGTRITSSTLVTDGKLAAAFIKSFSLGFIVRENVRWLPIEQYQKDPSTPPIPVFSVEITASVVTPQRKAGGTGLAASLNRSLFRKGEAALLTIATRTPARVAVFNLMADGKAVMLFPTDRTTLRTPGNNQPLHLPTPQSGLELCMTTLPGHARDAEGFFVAALTDETQPDWFDVFEPGNAMELGAFFRTYADMADRTEEKIIVYEVVSDKK
ncbi:MAG: hypothetical protein AB7E47_13410 [Desulfovibrionaceae bacterium]